ncbi:hypothetical protein [Armatimonas rosea]|uniref:Uncharacterized protein n=1 Tax=Armatimonas rosea TaxID=685828 RepID=A0A7W9SR86_ARMRO|nr:hypothetical protein [Armatimonas rosea]MBB6050519.1 hypothetical protein [Armatimonas rosea]
MPEDTPTLLQWVALGDEAQRKYAEETLYAQGSAVFPQVYEAVEKALDTYRRMLFAGEQAHWRIERLALFLAAFGEPSTIELLVQVRLSTSRNMPLARLLWRLEVRDDLATIQALLTGGFLLRKNFSFGPETLKIAGLLVNLAETVPCPELHQTRVLLRPGLGVPKEFAQLRKRLDAALGTEATLPLPADMAISIENLPIATNVEWAGKNLSPPINEQNDG